MGKQWEKTGGGRPRALQGGGALSAVPEASERPGGWWACATEKVGQHQRGGGFLLPPLTTMPLLTNCSSPGQWSGTTKSHILQLRAWDGHQTPLAQPTAGRRGVQGNRESALKPKAPAWKDGLPLPSRPSP